MLSVEAKYYAGGGLANAETNWTVTATPTNYTPPNRGDFTFGTWVPWWRVYDYGEYGGRPRLRRRSSQSFKGVTDASGKHLLKIDFESVKPPRPYTISASSSVMDVNRQTWSSFDFAARASVVALCRYQDAADICPEGRKDRRRVDRFRH